MVYSIHLVMPRAAVPMVVTREIQNAWARDIECHVVIIRELIKKMTGISSFIAAAPIIRAPHVGSCPDPLIRPLVPLSIRVQPDRDHRRLGCDHPPQHHPGEK